MAKENESFGYIPVFMTILVIIVLTAPLWGRVIDSTHDQSPSTQQTRTVGYYCEQCDDRVGGHILSDNGVEYVRLDCGHRSYNVPDLEPTN